jgi:hypothetical protein
MNYYRAAATEHGHAGVGHGPILRNRVGEYTRNAA